MRTIKAFVIILFVVAIVGRSRDAETAVTPFLLTPYYGEESITQGPGGSTHPYPAYDFGMKYESVLAAASGTIQRIEWQDKGDEDCIIGSRYAQNCGYGCTSPCTLTTTLSPNETWFINTINESCLGDPFVGSAHITQTSSPLAISDLQYHANYDSTIGSANVIPPATTAYGPLIQNDNGGWTSGFNLLNVASSYRTLTAYYYRTGGGAYCDSDSYFVDSYEVVVEYPAPPAGSSCTDPVLSARFDNTGTGASYLQGQVNQIILSQTEGAGYRAISEPGFRAIVPYVRRDSSWKTGLQIRNTSTTNSAFVTIGYYHGTGDPSNLAGSETKNIPAKGSVSIYPVLPPSAYSGTAIITSDQDVAVIPNQWRTDRSGDVIMSHVAPLHP